MADGEFVYDDISFSSGEESDSQIISARKQSTNRARARASAASIQSPEFDVGVATRKSSRRGSRRESYRSQDDNIDEILGSAEEDEESSNDSGKRKSTPTSAASEGAAIPVPAEPYPLQIENILARRKKYTDGAEAAVSRRHQLIAAAATETDDVPTSNAVSSAQSPERATSARAHSHSGSLRPASKAWAWEYLIKWKNYSYLHVTWETVDTLAEIDPASKRRIDRWVKKMENQVLMEGMESQAAYALGMTDDEGEGEPFDPNFTYVDRILASTVPDGQDGPSALYLVKWRELPHSEATWEKGEDVDDDLAIKAFRTRQILPPKQIWKPKPKPPPSKFKKIKKNLTYGLGQTAPPYKKSLLSLEHDNEGSSEGLQLRDYQIEGLNWLVFNYYNGRGCILADEMGLGKTAQSLTFLHHIATNKMTENFGPFLVVAPLSTIQHWAREARVWGDGLFNVVVYHGRQNARDIIREYDFFYPDPNGRFDPPERPLLLKSQPSNAHNMSAPVYKFNILVTTYEMVIGDRTLLSQIPWEAIIIDEAHRLKNRSSRLYQDLKTFRSAHMVLLTGTPIQNEIRELWALLHFLDANNFPVSSQETFLEQFGELASAEQVEKLHHVLRPYLLRRLKADVDSTLKLPPKEETIVEVELTALQKQYYRAIYERNTAFLMRGVNTSNAPNLMNVMMELRKCCNHPFLVHGVEETLADEKLAELQKTFSERLAEAQTQEERVAITAAHTHAQATSLAETLVTTSGKMVLLDKLLPRLKHGGHKVLIFSQMVRMLDILQDYCTARRFGFERLDGRLRGADRQRAIDRFTEPDSKAFVMLLSTRAGGLGINLTAADTVVIFDSDWNPQNDLQAQARAHRIGQKQSVKIYRLITRQTYEQHMFHRASLKLGLDQAVIGGMREGSRNTAKNQGQMNTKEVETLLKRGAYDVFNEGEEGDKASARFCEEDIDSILKRSTTVVYDDSKGKTSSSDASNKFSKASFVSDAAGEVDLDDPEFWTKAVGLQPPSAEEQVEDLGGGLSRNALGQIVDDEGNVVADRQRRRRQVARFTAGAADGIEDAPPLGEDIELSGDDESGDDWGGDFFGARDAHDNDENVAYSTLPVARQKRKGNSERGLTRGRGRGRSRKPNVAHNVRMQRVAMSGGTQDLGILDSVGWNLRIMYQEEQYVGDTQWGSIDVPWTTYERHKFHTAVWKYGWGRWHAIRMDARLWKRRISEIKMFAKAYLQCVIENARRALSDAAEQVRREGGRASSRRKYGGKFNRFGTIRQDDDDDAASAGTGKDEDDDEDAEEDNDDDENVDNEDEEDSVSVRSGTNTSVGGAPKRKKRGAKANVSKVRLQNWLDRPMPGQRVIAESEAMCPAIPRRCIPAVLLEPEFQTRLDADSSLKLLDRFDDLMALRDIVSVAAARYYRDVQRSKLGFPLRIDDKIKTGGFEDSEQVDTSIDITKSTSVLSYPEWRPDITHEELVDMPWPASGQTPEQMQAGDEQDIKEGRTVGRDDRVILTKEIKAKLPRLKYLPFLLDPEDPSVSADAALVEALRNAENEPHHVSNSIPRDFLTPQDEVPPHVVCDELQIEAIPRDELIKRIPLPPLGWCSSDSSRPNVDWWTYPYEDQHLLLGCFLDGFGKVDALSVDPRLHYAATLKRIYEALPTEKHLPQVPRLVLTAKGRQRTALTLQAAKGKLNLQRAHFKLPAPAKDATNPDAEDLNELIDVGTVDHEVANEIRAAYLMITVQHINRHTRRLTRPMANRSHRARVVGRALQPWFGGLYLPVSIRPLPEMLRPSIKTSSKRGKRGRKSGANDSNGSVGRSSKLSQQALSLVASGPATGALAQARATALRLNDQLSLAPGVDFLHGAGDINVDDFAQDSVCGMGGALTGPAARGKAQVSEPGVVAYVAPLDTPVSAYVHDKGLNSACEEAIEKELQRAWKSFHEQKISPKSSTSETTETDKNSNEMRELLDLATNGQHYGAIGAITQTNSAAGMSTPPSTSPKSDDIQSNGNDSNTYLNGDVGSSSEKLNTKSVHCKWDMDERRRLAAAISRFGIPDDYAAQLPAELQAQLYNALGVHFDATSKVNARPAFSWPALTVAAQLKKNPWDVCTYVHTQFLPHIMAAAAGKCGAYADEHLSSNAGDNYESNQKDSLIEPHQDVKADNSNMLKEASRHLQYSDMRALDPDTPLESVGTAERIFARQVLTRIGILKGIRWVNDIFSKNALRQILSTRIARTQLSETTTRLHSNFIAEARSTRVCADTKYSSLSATQLPIWWCPWVHDVALLELVCSRGLDGMDVENNSKTLLDVSQDKLSDTQVKNEGANIRYSSSWAWVRSTDDANPLHPNAIAQHVRSLFFGDAQSCKSSEIATSFMSHDDKLKLSRLRKGLNERLGSNKELISAYIDKVSHQWPCDTFLEARLLLLASALSPFRATSPRTIGAHPNISNDTIYRDYASVENRSELLECLWREAEQEQWGWPEGDAWSSGGAHAPFGVSLRQQAGWWLWGVQSAPCVAPSEEHWSAWGASRGTVGNGTALWGIGAGHIPSAVVMPRSLKNDGGLGSVGSVGRCEYLARVHTHSNLSHLPSSSEARGTLTGDYTTSVNRDAHSSGGDISLASSDTKRQRNAGSNETAEKCIVDQQPTAPVDPQTPSHTDVSQGALAVRDFHTANHTQRTFDSWTASCDPFWAFSAACVRSEVKYDGNASLRVKNGLRSFYSDAITVPKWAENMGHSWCGLGPRKAGEGSGTLSSDDVTHSSGNNADEVSSCKNEPSAFPFYLSWRGLAGIGCPYGVEPPKSSDLALRNLSCFTDIAVRLPRQFASQYTGSLNMAIKKQQSLYASVAEFQRQQQNGDVSMQTGASHAADQIQKSLDTEKINSNTESSLVSVPLYPTARILMEATEALQGQDISVTKRLRSDYEYVAQKYMDRMCSSSGQDSKRQDRRTAKSVAAAVWKLVQSVEQAIEKPTRRARATPTKRKRASAEDSGNASIRSDDDQTSFASHMTNTNTNEKISGASTNKTARTGGKPRKPRVDVTLADLIGASLLSPGEGVLEMRFRGSNFKADLTSEGIIVSDGEQYTKPSSWSLVMKRRVVPDKATDDGWHSVRYNGRALIEFKREYIAQLEREQMERTAQQGSI